MRRKVEVGGEGRKEKKWGVREKRNIKNMNT